MRPDGYPGKIAELGEIPRWNGEKHAAPMLGLTQGAVDWGTGNNRRSCGAEAVEGYFFWTR